MRTLSTIKDSIRADFVADTTLQEAYDLDSSKTFDEQFSSVSLEAILTYIVAVAIWAFESVLNTHETDIDDTITSQAVTSIPWYYQLCLNFQLGYVLTLNEDTYAFEYSEEDDDAKIIEFAAVRQIQSANLTKLKIYVSKADKAALSTTELEAFTSYVSRAGAAGIHYDIVSESPTSLSFTIEVVRDPLLLDSSGQLLTDGSTKPVEEAISDYLDGITYGAVFNRTKLVDAIQEATGVSDVILNDVQISGESVATQNIEAAGGAFTFDSSDSIITYTV